MNYEAADQKTITLLAQFIECELQRSGLSGFVIGLSGGIDSSLSAALAMRAVGAKRVLGISMPYRTSSPRSLTDAQTLADQLGIEYREVDISPMIDAYFQRIEPSARLRAGNKMARERMSILFDIAYETKRLVLGTGNRTEDCLGYTTIFGDSACSINPLGELYKTEVRRLARALDLPETIVSKPPSADLWVDQTDEGEIGVTYDTIDAILRLVVDEGVTSMAALESSGLNRSHIERVIALMNQNAFKRALPPVASLGRTEVPSRIKLGA